MVAKMLKLILLAMVVSKSCLMVEATASQCAKTIRKWSPLVFLARGEEFKPSTVEFFLDKVKIDGTNGHLHLTPSNLPSCHRGCFLTSRQPMRSSTSTSLPFFKGQHVRDASAYAVIEKKNGLAEINYWFFYPFNLGKDVCLGVYNKHSICPCPKFFGHCICPRIPAGCIGKYKQFGNHVGDWENIKVVLRLNGSPVKIVYYAHGDAHEYVEKNGGYFNNHGQRLRFEGTHPVVFSAKGSHGSRASGGRHVYQTIPTGYELADECSEGDRWETWHNLRMVQRNNFNNFYHFMNFKGRWGNRKSGCGAFDIYEKIADECERNDGPHGPYN